MDTFIELFKVLGPALIVLYAVYLMVRSFLTSRNQELRSLISQKSQETILPIRLQAYERIALLLERISPSNIITRLNNPEFTAKEFQQVLVSEIRQEFNHNLAQQIYLSDEAWAYVSGAVEDIVTTINEAGRSLPEDAKGLDLAKAVFEGNIEKESVRNALNFIKNEIREVF
jgi:ribosomal protein S8